MTPEAKVKKEIRAYLDSLGAYHFSPVQTGYGKATVDILACVKGRFVAIEAKVKGKPTARQKQTLKEVTEAGGIAFSAYSAAQAAAWLRNAFYP